MKQQLSFSLDHSQLERRVRRALVSVPQTLDRFVKRGANEFARAEKIEAPKALTILTNSIQATQNGIGDWSIGPTAKYAAAINNGGRPHWAPIAPLMDWLRVTKKVTDKKELRTRAKGLQRFIAKNGTKANPFVQRTRKTMDERMVSLIHDGAYEAFTRAFEQ